MKLKLDIAPVAKGRPRLGRGRTYTPAKTLRFESSIKLLTAHLEPMSGPLKLDVTFVFARPKAMPKKLSKRQPRDKRPDTDNLIKALGDALNGHLYHDDSQLVEITARKLYAGLGEQPCIELICSEYSDEESAYA